ncbi:MAG: 4-hydroxy-2-oxoheptanedioate aldolase [Verrucomicrobia bacterium]|nr:4-hydroxy-2-oxoheptanedioate aldolase [Verrucomicrobiota bacterium]
MLAQLRQGQIPTILKLNLSDPRVSELAGLSGTDAVWLCTEHVPNDWIGIENQIRAARLHDIDCLVRVARGSYSSYILPLEAGATGIIVPHVASAEEARQIVEWTRFHPLGKRALDGGNVDGLFCQLPMDEYIRHSNEEVIVILQIESPEALENVEEIAAVPGFDMLLFGAGDFSHRIGKVGKMDSPEILNARKRIGAAARKHGKFAMLPGMMAPLPELLAEGYRVFGCGSDVYGLGLYFKQRVDFMHEQVTGLPPEAKAHAKSHYA